MPYSREMVLVSLAIGSYCRYTQAMKTAISIPDTVFAAADELAQRLQLSRSQLYSRAVESFVQAHRQESVTAALDRVYATEPSELAPSWVALQSASLQKDEW